MTSIILNQKEKGVGERREKKGEKEIKERSSLDGDFQGQGEVSYTL